VSPGSESNEAALPVAAAASLEASGDAYLRRNLLRALASLVLLFAAMLVAGVLFDRELLEFTQWVERSIGLPGLALLLFFADSVGTPIPPDALLIVVAKTELSRDWAWLVPLGGVLSSVAGAAGYAIGAALGRHPALTPWIAWLSRRHGTLIERYDRLTVALGALTPLPFSLTCWSAGAMGMPLSRFVPVSLLRVPRYVVYYLAIAYADRIAQSLAG
jgi:membrane protein YqaA with SNARE-associated domain